MSVLGAQDWFSLPQWMDNLGSGVGPAELFFSGLAAAIITVSVYTPWMLRQRRAKNTADQD